MNFSFILAMVVILKIASSLETVEEWKETRNKRGLNPYSYSNHQQFPSYELNGDDNNFIGTGGEKFCLDSRPHCQVPKSCLDPNSLPRNADKSLIPRTFYVAMGTCYGYSLAAEILLNRQVRTYQELYEMCPSLFAINSDDYYSGYGKQFAQTCTGNSNNPQRDCVTLVNGTDADIDTSPMSLDSPTVFDSDGKTWILFYRCVNRHFGDFLVLATRPYIDSKRDFQKIMDTVIALGFSENEILLWPCSTPKYTHSKTTSKVVKNIHRQIC